jgi:hypothetical protein
LLAAGALAAALMQSSAAPIAIAMSALFACGVAFRVAAPLVVGASVGTTSTALLVVPFSRWLVARVPDRGPALLRHIDEVGGGVPAVVLEGLRRGVAAMGAVALRAADARMRGQPAAGQDLLDDIRNAGRALRGAAATAGTEGLGTEDMERQVASLQALEHAKAIRSMLQRDDLTPPPNLHSSIHDFMESASAGVLAAAAWLEQPRGEAPSTVMRKLVREAVRRRQAARLGTLEATGAGKVSVDDANAHLDAMRAIDTLVEHAWRLVSDLDVAITARDADDDAAIGEEVA